MCTLRRIARGPRQRGSRLQERESHLDYHRRAAPLDTIGANHQISVENALLGEVKTSLTPRKYPSRRRDAVGPRHCSDLLEPRFWIVSGLPTTRPESSETARKKDAHPSVSGASLESRSELCRRIGARSRVVEHFFRA
jgi:hypothetical protein